MPRFSTATLYQWPDCKTDVCAEHSEKIRLKQPIPSTRMAKNEDKPVDFSAKLAPYFENTRTPNEAARYKIMMRGMAAN